MKQQTVLFDAPGPLAARRTRIVNIITLAVVAVGIALVLVKLYEMDQLSPTRWGNALNSNAWVNYYLPGLRFTLQASVIAVITSMLFGLIFGFLRLAPIAPVRWFATVVVEFFRSVPVLVMMFFLYNYFAKVVASQGIINAADAPYYAVIVGLTLYNGAVIAELIRSGVHTLPRGQREAASAIGMTRNQSLAFVEVPQALVAMLPALMSQFVVILKDSALGYLIGFYEVLQYARQLGSGQSNMLQTLVVAAVIFIILNYILTWLAGRMARRLSSRTSGEVEADVTTAAPAKV